MSNHYVDWHYRYEKLYQEFVQLQKEHAKLKKLYEQSVEGSIHDINLINRLSSENEELKIKLSQYQFSTPKVEIITKTPKKALQCSVSSDSYILFTPRCSHLNAPNNFTFDTLHQKPCQSTGKTLQPHPDNSVSSFMIHNPKMFISFFILGVPREKLGRADRYKPEILYEFPKENWTISDEVKRMVLNCCFHSEEEPQPVNLTGSGSDMNALLYGQVFQKRGNHCFTFTLRSDQPKETLTDLPNSNKELYYVFCMKIDDVTPQMDGQDEWKNTKIYCFITYLPLFELHYEVLSNMLLLKRLFRIEQLVNNEKTMHLIGEEIITPGEIKVLENYSEVENIEPMLNIEIDMDRLDPLRYKCPDDLSVVDVPWLCAPLFSKLNFNDFFWILSAIAQEKSIIFVSENLGLLTSCVLAMQVLLRPFRWPNLMIPILPRCLIDVLDAPVPLLAGVPKPPKSRGDLIWIYLDESNLSSRIKGKSSIIQEVKVPEASQLKLRIKNTYLSLNSKEICFSPTLDQKLACIEIAEAIKDYWLQIIDITKMFNLKDMKKLVWQIHKRFPEGDHDFLTKMLQTQLFNNLDDEILHTSTCND